MQVWPCCGWAGGGLGPVSSTAPSLAIGVPAAEAAPVLGQPHLPRQRSAPTMGKAIPGSPSRPWFTGRNPRVGKTLF